MKELFPVQEKAEMLANLKRNWYFPISAMAFFCLAMDDTIGYCIGLLIAFLIMILIASQIDSVWNAVKQHSTSGKLFCFFSAIGISLGNQKHFYEETVKLTLKLELPAVFDRAFLLVSYFGAVCAVFFVFFCLLVFWKEMKRIISAMGLLSDIDRKEKLVYALLLVVLIGFMAFAFTQTQAFYGTDQLFDIIYTSDSPDLVKENAYIALTHNENDLRQPLFAVFAAPFVGIPYLVSRVLHTSASVQAILLNTVQIFMLLAANFMLAKMLKLDSGKRILFMLLTSSTYMQLLFMLMMEQYIVAYFWLILCVYLIVEKQTPDRMALWGAGGTMLTSMILLPLLSNKSPIKDFKAWFWDMVKYGLEFVALILIFCRFDVIFNVLTVLSQLSGYAGTAVTLADKVYQYTAFIESCFVAPNAGAGINEFGYISWQLNTVTDIHFMGLLILALVVISALWNRDKTISLLAAGWVGFSVVMLLGLGWGTQENGLILYVLYFGWAFFVLLFQLVERIEDKLHIRFLVPAFSIIATAALLFVNIPAFMEMMDFAMAYYPA